MAVRTARSLRPARPRRATLINAAASSSMTVRISCCVALAELTHDLAVGEEEHAVRHGRRACVVRHHDDRLAVLVDRAAEELEDLPARGRVEVAGRLVREQHRRLRDERAGNRDALLLPAGELGRAVRQPVAETHVGDELVEPAVLRLLARDRQRERDVLLRVKHRQQVEELEDEADVLTPQLRQVVVAERRDLGSGDARPSPTSACRGPRGCASASTCPSPTAP